MVAVRQHVDRHAHQRQRHDGRAAHGIDVADGVGGGDAAEVERVVDDGHEEVGGGDQRLLVVEPVDGGVVGGLDAHQQLFGDGHLRRALEDVRQHAGRDLAAAAAAVRERGEAGFGGGDGHLVQARFGHRLTTLNQGIARDGAFYLFTLRLIPAMPFFVLNLLAGLTHMKIWTFAWVSQLGMLAATLVFVNAGTEIARIDSLASILSPSLIGSFVLLGLLPLAVKKVADAQRRKVYARWKTLRPKRFDRNLVVIGAGAGGLVTAYIAAAVKAKVTLVEAHKMGGDCLNYGCVPSKALIRTARLAHQMRHGARYGLSDCAPAFSFRPVMQRIHA
jgi:hypothetical protein